MTDLLINGEQREAAGGARFERFDPVAGEAATSAEAHVPFDGVKGIGYGRFGGKAEEAVFTTLRWITIVDPDALPHMMPTRQI